MRLHRNYYILANYDLRNTVYFPKVICDFATRSLCYLLCDFIVTHCLCALVVTPSLLPSLIAPFRTTSVILLKYLSQTVQNFCKNQSLNILCSTRSPSFSDSIAETESDEYFPKDKQPRDSWVWLHASKVQFFFNFFGENLFAVMI